MIVSICYAVRPVPIGYDRSEHQAGEDLRMADGSLWFHPYTGRAPIMIEGPK